MFRDDRSHIVVKKLLGNAVEIAKGIHMTFHQRLLRHIRCKFNVTFTEVTQDYNKGVQWTFQAVYIKLTDILCPIYLCLPSRDGFKPYGCLFLWCLPVGLDKVSKNCTFPS